MVSVKVNLSMAIPLLVKRFRLNGHNEEFCP